MGSGLNPMKKSGGLQNIKSVEVNIRMRFDYHINRPWTTTLIKNFKGKVSFQVIHREGVYDCATEFHKVGDSFSDDEVRVVGNGINIMTGEKIDFVGRQTGF